MHIITQQRIWEAKKKYPESSSALDEWYRIVKANNYHSFSDLKATFPSIDKVGKYHVFNIGGNKIRLIAIVEYNFNKLFIRQILSHKEYDKNKWKQ
jgi:mRNA interferase HigB